MLPASIFSDEISPDFAEAVATAAQCGLRSIDLRDAWGKRWQQFERQDWQRMRQLLRERDMQLGCIQSQFGKCNIGEEYETSHFPKVDYLISEVIAALQADGYAGLYSIETHFGSRGPYGWPKLRAASTWSMYALRELLENAGLG